MVFLGYRLFTQERFEKILVVKLNGKCRHINFVTLLVVGWLKWQGYCLLKLVLITRIAAS